MKKFIFFIIVSLLIIAISNCSSKSDVAGLDIFPQENTVPAGFAKKYDLTATYKDYTKDIVTLSADWISDDPSVASIVSSGIITGNRSGSTKIKVTYMGITKEINVNVTNSSLVSVHISPLNPDMVQNAKKQFTATGIFSDGTKQNLTSQAEWHSDESTIAYVDDMPGSKGIVTIKNPGITRISATIGNIKGSTVINAPWVTLESINITPVNPKSSREYTVKFKATGVYSNKTTQNLTDQVKWSSSSSSIAIISNEENSKGFAKAKNKGDTIISASLGDIIGNTILKVTSSNLISIQINPVNVEKPAGLTQQFQAIGIFSDGSNQNITVDVIWSILNSDNNEVEVAVISNQKGYEGRARGLSPGIAIIEAVIPSDGFFSTNKKGSMKFKIK